MGKASRRKRQEGGLRGATPSESPQPARAPSNFEFKYGTELLRGFGPFFFASWWLPSSLAQTLAASGKIAPSPVAGVIVIDTGADATCISVAAAEQLGLKPTRIQSGYGLSGQTDSRVYFARLELRIKDPRGAETILAWEQEVLGVPNLDHRRIAMADGRQLNVVGLFGRDILRHCIMLYNGPTGIVRVQFDLAAIKLTQSVL
jgi:hypothetical protein